MATAIVDHIEDMSAEEDAGRIVSLTRMAFVHGLTGTGAGDKVEQMLAATNMPASGSTYTIGTNTLILRKRSPKMSGDPGIGNVTLHYEREDAIGGGAGSPPAAGSVIFSGGTSSVQITTEKMPDGSALPTVEHTWPAATSTSTAEEAARAGKKQTQGGELSVSDAQSTLSCKLIVATNSPGAITETFANKLNSTTWQGAGPRKWRCDSATFDSVDLVSNPQKWEMTFNWQKHNQGWDKSTYIAFIDPTTSRVPPGLVDGVGIKAVDWFGEVDFNYYFN